MSNARLDWSAEGTDAVGNSANQLIPLSSPRLSLRHSFAREALRKAFGADLRRERTERRISQDKLAARCGLHPRTIAKIEAGEIGIRPETLDRIQRAIGCTFNNGTIEKREFKGREHQR